MAESGQACPGSAKSWSGGAVKLEDLIGQNWLESLFFIRTLEDNNSASCDWIYAIQALLDSPWSGLYVYQILDELAG